MLKLWDKKNNFVCRESAMFIGRNEIRTLFPIREILRITSPASGSEYIDQEDFSYHPGSRHIRRIPGSSIPEIPQKMVRPDENAPLFPAPDARAIGGACDGGRLIFNNESFFAENQILIDYRAEDINFVSELDAQSDRLPEFRRKLAAGEKIRITLLGDSISEGFNATAFTGCAPYTPPYIEQLCRNLTDLFRVQITLHNRAVNGTGCRSAEQNAANWTQDRPDLLIIAFGMNDFQSMTAEEFVTVNRRLIDLCREVSPTSEAVLVTSMTGHPFWKGTVPGHDAEFADAVRKFVASSDKSIALADVQKVWKKLLVHKDFYDLTGNGVNHPNDYGHTVYASVLTQLLAGIEMF